MKKIFLLVFATIGALVPGYLMRINQDVYMWFFNTFKTYPGDLWNFFANYLDKGLHYPPEYPAGLRWFYEVMGFWKYRDYTWFFTVNALILAAFAIGTTILIYKIQVLRQAEETTESPLNNQPSSALSPDDDAKARRMTGHVWPGAGLFWFWILAPSFIVYSFINYDLPVIFLIVLAVYLYHRNHIYGAVASLALGMVVKVFPVFLLPVFILKSPKKHWPWLALLFGAIVVGLNLPYAIENFDSWLFPYTWQIGQNVSRDPTAGTYWWIFYPWLKNYLGWTSLGLFSGLYLFTYRRLRQTSLENFCLAVILIFLATDRIYSPQYNMYLLPFLAMADYRVKKGPFYLLEIPNAIHILALFWLKNHLVLFQSLIAAKYIAIVWLYVENYRNNRSLLKNIELR